MKRIEIRVRNEQKAKALLEFLRSLDFVELTETNEGQSDKRVDNEAFFALAGIWEGRDDTLDSIRHEAWPRQTS